MSCGGLFSCEDLHDVCLALACMLSCFQKAVYRTEYMHVYIMCVYYTHNIYISTHIYVCGLHI